ncbi:MAG: hypothetical protein IJE84_02265 [Clostridia bacterium]|nr:hypothetical protein [Clostridia bacterium]
MLGSLIFVSKVIMEVLPNIHLVGMLTMLYTVVYRAKALIPLYVYIFLNGLFAGFATWWVPYLYIWTVLWGMTMLIPKNIKPSAARVVYPAICALHGFMFGILYAPGQALLFGYDLKMTLAWIAAGVGFDITMGVSNIFAGMLVYPLSVVLYKLEYKSAYSLIKK